MHFTPTHLSGAYRWDRPKPDSSISPVRPALVWTRSRGSNRICRISAEIDGFWRVNSRVRRRSRVQEWFWPKISRSLRYTFNRVRVLCRSDVAWSSESSRLLDTPHKCAYETGDEPKSAGIFECVYESDVWPQWSSEVWSAPRRIFEKICIINSNISNPTIQHIRHRTCHVWIDRDRPTTPSGAVRRIFEKNLYNQFPTSLIISQSHMDIRPDPTPDISETPSRRGGGFSKKFV